MIKIENLKVGVGNKEILKGINLCFELGKNYCILGRNGSGKSSLASVLAGNPKYKTLSGNIMLNSTSVLDILPEERSKAGIFLAFQNVPEIKGINLSEYLRTIYNTHLKSSSLGLKELSPFLFKRFIKKYLDELNIESSFLSRELNVGFSGGEKRKIEVLQMRLIGPKYIILDEIDSGLDLDAFKTIASMIKKISSKENSFIIITHYFKILEFLKIDKVYIIEDGKVVKEGGTQLIEKLKGEGFDLGNSG